MLPSLAELPLLGPAGLLCGALLPSRPDRRRPQGILLASRLATVFAVVLAVLACVLVAAQGAITSPLLGHAGIGLSVRLDAISCSMFLLVAFVGVIVVQYSRNYMDGDLRQGAFMAGLCRTLAAVMLLVLAGNLVQLVAAWVATSLSLHRLLVFYPERRSARVAARKKFVVARLGDASLLGAAAVLVATFHTTDIARILMHAKTMPAGTASSTLSMAALLLGVAALMKSAQFPSHGWLPEVMDTPTPVSALLHAGIINAGGFLMIRFADVMLLSMPTLHVIALIGGFTALFGGVVMLTQTSVKGSLAWSTVAQMGFMTLQCGLGAFAIALLHLVTHSLYKAHAFLSAGSVVETEMVPAFARPRLRLMLFSLLLAMAIYAGFGWLFGVFARHEPAVLTLGAILVMGVSMLLSSSLYNATARRLLLQTMAGAAGTTLAYFLLETAVTRLTASSLPAIPEPDGTGLLIMGLAIASFAAVTVLQSLVVRCNQKPAWRAARVHLANGFYVNALFDRLIGALRQDRTHDRGTTVA
jgi:NAD(P)H-quinone oxidoreductase subunit 5